MEKGLEITFQVPGRDRDKIVMALANLVGNEFLKEFKVQWRIFDVTLEKKRFFKVCFIGHKLTKLHPHIEDKVRKRFDELAHLDKRELLKTYNEERNLDNFTTQNIEEKKEEYDLWQDNFWQFF